MSITSTKRNKYLQIFNRAKFPENPQGIGIFMNQENNPEIALAFTTHRDIITEIGVKTYDSDCPEDLKICLGVVLDQVVHKQNEQLGIYLTIDVLLVFDKERAFQFD